jgi:L-amino acid N-acyltransferase YncA
MERIHCSRQHAPEILAILNEAIENSVALWDYKPRTLEMMDAWFDAKERGAFPVVGLVDAQRGLLAFGSYGTFRAWPAYKYSVEHSIYVRKDARRNGYGKLILEALIEEARRQGYHNLIAGIATENAVSIALHQKLGFDLCGTIRQAGFKFGRWIDLSFYQRLLDTPAQPVDG